MEKSNTKAYLVGGVIGLVSMGLLSFTGLGLILAIIVGIVLGGVISLTILARARGEVPQENVKEVVKEVLNPTPEALEKRVNEQLLNLSLNTRQGLISSEVTEATDKVIDLLSKVVPRALSESPNTEASFNLMKVSTEYFPDVIRKYIGLSEENRASEQGAILQQITDINEMVSAAEDSLNTGDLGNFKVSNAFLKIKTL